jgi:outer membrane protein assembly factor BamE (lipoprotein component of BamABCDE complex)
MAMRRLAIALVVALAATAGCRASREFHGYVPDQALPTDVQPNVDTRTTVLARLGSPSTTSIFDDKLWVYMSSTRENLEAASTVFTINLPDRVQFTRPRIGHRPD